jgi:hypothetical protein
LHQEIKEKVQDLSGIAHLPNGLRVLQPRLIPDPIRPIFAALLMNWPFASTVASGAREEWGEGITGLLCHRQVEKKYDLCA